MIGWINEYWSWKAFWVCITAQVVIRLMFWEMHRIAGKEVERQLARRGL